MNTIDPMKLDLLFLECMSTEGKEVEGLSMSVCLDVSGHEEEIKEMLGVLPTDFRKEVGGGASFLIGCQTRDGEVWTGLHKSVEQLFLLGIAAGFAEYTLPDRRMWACLPGGMPYLTLKGLQ